MYYTDSTVRPHPLGPISLPYRVLGQQPRRGSTNGNCSGGGGSVRYGVVGFTGVRPGVFGFIQGRWLPWGSPWESLGSSGVVGFAGFRPGGHWVPPWSLCSLGFAQGVVGFAGVCPGGRRVHPRSLGSLGFALRVVGFIRGGWVWGRRVHRGSLSSLGFALGVVAHTCRGFALQCFSFYIKCCRLFTF